MPRFITVIPIQWRRCRRLRYDLFYLEHRLWFFDFKILVKTFLNIAFGKKFDDYSLFPSLSFRGKIDMEIHVGSYFLLRTGITVLFYLVNHVAIWVEYGWWLFLMIFELIFFYGCEVDGGDYAS